MPCMGFMYAISPTDRDVDRRRVMERKSSVDGIVGSDHIHVRTAMGFFKRVCSRRVMRFLRKMQAQNLDISILPPIWGCTAFQFCFSRLAVREACCFILATVCMKKTHLCKRAKDLDERA